METEEVKETLGLSGLFNMGNTCYFNTIIQCLSNTKFLCAYLLTNQHLKVFEKKNITDYEDFVSYKLGNLLKHMWSKNEVCIPRELSEVISSKKRMFHIGIQNDAEELLNYILEKIHEECKIHAFVNRITSDELLNSSISFWNNYIKNNYSIITDLMTGVFCNFLICTECKNTLNIFEPFNVLSIPIPNGATNLSQCLEEFGKSEILENDDSVFCEKCNKKTKTIKKIFIWEISNVVIIHLKRFKMLDHSEKNCSPIDFPIHNLTFDENYHPDYQKNYKYNLYAIVNHSGDVGSGHYFAYCKNFLNEKWYLYNDSSISELNGLNSNVLSEGYIFMYIKN